MGLDLSLKPFNSLSKFFIVYSLSQLYPQPQEAYNLRNLSLCSRLIRTERCVLSNLKPYEQNMYMLLLTKAFLKLCLAPHSMVAVVAVLKTLTVKDFMYGNQSQLYKTTSTFVVWSCNLQGQTPRIVSPESEFVSQFLSECTSP